MFRPRWVPLAGSNAPSWAGLRCSGLVETGSGTGFVGLAWAERSVPSGLISAELRRQRKRSPSPTCSAKRRETPAPLAMPGPGTGSEIFPSTLP